MKIKQLALRVPDLKLVKKNLEKYLGAKFEINDKLEMKGEFTTPKFSGHWDSKECTVKDVELSFDYNILKDCDELELIHTSDVNHWHSWKGYNESFISHLGIYCDSMKELDEIRNRFQDFEILQDTISLKHSRKNKSGSERSYRDVIIATECIFGFNLKLSYKI